MTNLKLTSEKAVSMYIDLQLPRARERLSEKLVELQMHLSYVGHDVTRYGSSTKTSPLPNMLTELLLLHEKVALLTEVEKLSKLPG
jgi:hypothetical protein